MIIHTMPQRTEEWYDIRRGKMTASNAAAIATGGKGLETYIYQILAEKYSSNRDPGYCSQDMMRGIELEDQARQTYEIEREEVKQVGFVEMDEFTGCSPDGLVGDMGGIEIKCPNDANYFRLLVDGDKAIDTRYIWQVQMAMLITGRERWDIINYNPNFDQNMVGTRIERDREKQEKLIIGIARGKKLIQELTQKYEHSN